MFHVDVFPSVCRHSALDSAIHQWECGSGESRVERQRQPCVTPLFVNIWTWLDQLVRFPFSVTPVCLFVGASMPQGLSSIVKYTFMLCGEDSTHPLRLPLVPCTWILSVLFMYSTWDDGDIYHDRHFICALYIGHLKCIGVWDRRIRVWCAPCLI